MMLVPREILRIELSCTYQRRAGRNATDDLGVAEVEPTGRVAVVAERDGEGGRHDESEHGQAQEVDLQLRRANLICVISAA